jgi:hypothetical protein
VADPTTDDISRDVGDATSDDISRPMGDVTTDGVSVSTDVGDEPSLVTSTPVSTYVGVS